jgi:fibronectin type 3 domain-containing protein
MTIAAGQSASFGVVFSPKASGAVSGTLAIASNASNSSATESLSGTGTPNAVTLSWTPSTSSVVGYNIYRGTASSGPFSKINSSMDTATNYTDGSVMGGNTYFYVATSVNSAGQESSFSSPALQAVVP